MTSMTKGFIMTFLLFNLALAAPNTLPTDFPVQVADDFGGNAVEAVNSHYANFTIAVAAGPSTSESGCNRDHQENCDLHLVQVMGQPGRPVTDIAYDSRLTAFAADVWAIEPDFNPSGTRVAYVARTAETHSAVTQPVSECIDNPNDAVEVGKGARPDYYANNEVWFSASAGARQSLRIDGEWDTDTIVGEFGTENILDGKPNPIFPNLVLINRQPDPESPYLSIVTNLWDVDESGTPAESIATSVEANIADAEAGHPFWHPSGRSFIGGVDRYGMKGVPHVYSQNPRGEWLNDGDPLFVQDRMDDMINRTTEDGSSPYDACDKVWHSRVNFCDRSEFATASVQCVMTDATGPEETLYSRVYLIDYSQPTSPVYHDITSPIANELGVQPNEFQAYTANCAPQQ
jgi:hypothetical protein